MDEDSDVGAVAQGTRSLVEPEGLLNVAHQVGATAALGQYVSQVEL
jgi:hypothetical protein